MDLRQEWPAEWLRGVLELCVLRAVAGGPYGYEIAARLEGGGLGKVKGGTLYPLLKRFEAKQWVEVEWRPGEGGPGRKYYALTGQGRRHLEETAALWGEFAAVIGSLLAGAGMEPSTSSREDREEGTPLRPRAGARSAYRAALVGGLHP